MNIAYKFRIYANKEQKHLFSKTFGCVRFIYNKMLSEKITYYEKTKKKLNNTPSQYKNFQNSNRKRTDTKAIQPILSMEI